MILQRAFAYRHTPGIKKNPLIPKARVYSRLLFKAILFIVIYFLSISLTCFAAQVSSAIEVPSAHKIDRILPFQAGEAYFFVVTYLGFSVGKATLQVAEERNINGKNIYHFVSTAQTNRFFDLFYKIRNQAESWWDERLRHSLHYKTYQEEADEIRTKEIVFYPERELVIYKRGDSEERLYLDKKVQDTLSAFYFLRTMDLSGTNLPVIIETFDSRRLWEVKVFILGREEVEVPAGVFNTIKVKPILDYEGIFRQRGDIVIWLTDDKKKMPVKVKSKVKIGSFEAVLDRYEPR